MKDEEGSRLTGLDFMAQEFGPSNSGKHGNHRGNENLGFLLFPGGPDSGKGPQSRRSHNLVLEHLANYLEARNYRLIVSTYASTLHTVSSMLGT